MDIPETECPDRKPMAFVSCLEDANSKTTLVQEDDAFRIRWSPEDKIKVFSSEDASGAEFTIDSEQSASMMSVTFTGEIAGTSPFAAIYPSFFLGGQDTQNAILRGSSVT